MIGLEKPGEPIHKMLEWCSERMVGGFLLSFPEYSLYDCTIIKKKGGDTSENTIPNC